MSSNNNIPNPNTAVFSEVYPVEKVLGQCDIMHIIYIASTYHRGLRKFDMYYIIGDENEIFSDT